MSQATAGHQDTITARTAVLLVNLGTPTEPTAKALRPYLSEFLSDPRVVEIPRLLWWPILHGIILRLRPAVSARKYATIWQAEGSPLRVWTQRQTQALNGQLAARGHQVRVSHAMRYGQPAIRAQLDALTAAGAERVLIVPLYPQYSGATTASVLDQVAIWTQATRALPEMRHVGAFQDDPGYIEALAARVQEHWHAQGRAGVLVMSFHGMPARTRALGDPYHDQCVQTGRMLARRLALSEDDYRITFQSRFGKARWLEPYTEPTLRTLARTGTERVDVICPGFVADCIETLEEIAMEAKDAFLSEGGTHFHYIPCLNDAPTWMSALTDLVERHLQGWATRP